MSSGLATFLMAQADPGSLAGGPPPSRCGCRAASPRVDGSPIANCSAADGCTKGAVDPAVIATRQNPDRAQTSAQSLELRQSFLARDSTKDAMPVLLMAWPPGTAR